MGQRKRSGGIADGKTYNVDTERTQADLAVLAELKEAEALLPADAPRALLSIRLSVLTEDTTSPVRQELDLRIEAKHKGYRVVGVASDLNVSATKVPPWKRKELGDWLNNRAPEFDVLMFWKLDRFVRRLTDLSTMIDWCLKYGKNLVSKNDTIDLSTVLGQMMVTLIGGIAEIEATNTSTRVTNLWDYTKTQSEWHVGLPSYGYKTARDENNKVIVVHDPMEVRALRWSRKRAVKNVSASRQVKILIRAGIYPEGTTVSTHIARLRNPALMGYRVEEIKSGGNRRSRAILDKDGKPIRVAEEIFTPDEFAELQVALDKRKLNGPETHQSGVTKFLGVLICVDCKKNMTVQNSQNKHGSYKYLRCRVCKGLGGIDPNPVYERMVLDVLTVLGDVEVQVREYARGAEARAKVKELEESIKYYMEGLEPGGRYSRSQFTRDQAEDSLDRLITELNTIGPETTEDRWVNVANGMTFRQHWEEGGMEAMTADLNRVGVKCEVTRTRIPDQKEPQVHLRLLIPADVKNRLILREDDFASKL